MEPQGPRKERSGATIRPDVTPSRREGATACGRVPARRRPGSASGERRRMTRICRRCRARSSPARRVDRRTRRRRDEPVRIDRARRDLLGAARASVAAARRLGRHSVLEHDEGVAERAVRDRHPSSPPVKLAAGGGAMTRPGAGGATVSATCGLTAAPPEMDGRRALRSVRRRVCRVWLASPRASPYGVINLSFVYLSGPFECVSRTKTIIVSVYWYIYAYIPMFVHSVPVFSVRCWISTGRHYRAEESVPAEPTGVGATRALTDGRSAALAARSVPESADGVRVVLSVRGTRSNQVLALRDRETAETRPAPRRRGPVSGGRGGHRSAAADRSGTARHPRPM